MSNTEKIGELEAQLQELQAEIEALKAKPKKGRWKPGDGEAYHYVCNYLRAEKNWYTQRVQDKLRFLFGNCYETAELALRQAEKERLIIEIWDWWYEHDGVWPDWESNGIKCLMRYCHYDKAWELAETQKGQTNLFLPYFSSRELAKGCIEHFGGRLDLLLTKRWEE